MSTDSPFWLRPLKIQRAQRAARIINLMIMGVAVSQRKRIYMYIFVSLGNFNKNSFCFQKNQLFHVFLYATIIDHNIQQLSCLPPFISKRKDISWVVWSRNISKPKGSISQAQCHEHLSIFFRNNTEQKVTLELSTVLEARFVRERRENEQREVTYKWAKCT